jgi:coenzyme PQQ synthesis protein D (PqqD)
MPNIRVKPSPDIMFQRLGDAVVLLNLTTNRIFELNRTGARFWELLAAGQDLVSIEDILTSEFEVERGEVTAEVGRMLASMRAEQLVIIGD